MSLSSSSPFSKNTGSKGSRASETRALRSKFRKAIFAVPLSTLASSSRPSTSPRIWPDMVRMLPANRSRSVSEQSGDLSSSALVVMTVSGVFSSWEASATNCRCCSHARSTGRTAQRARAKLMPRKTRKLMMPTRAEVRMRLFTVACSLEVSAKTINLPMGSEWR